MVLSQELTLSAFFACLWVGDKVAHKVKVSSVLSHVVVGVVFGPAAADVLPDASVDTLQLLGTLGVFLLVVEGGLSVDFAATRAVAGRATAAAVVGVAGPVGLAFVVLGAGYGLGWKACLAAGAALAPTSLGFSATLLAEVTVPAAVKQPPLTAITGDVAVDNDNGDGDGGGGVAARAAVPALPTPPATPVPSSPPLDDASLLQSPFGSVISAAAVMDDVIALVLLAEVQSLDDDSATAADYAAPLWGSAVAVVVGTAIATMASSRIQRLASLPPPTLITLMLLVAAGFAAACVVLQSSALLGCFLAGLTFSPLHARVAPLWSSAVAPVSWWGVALFFAATIGFAIPSVTGDLLTVAAFTRGLLLFCAAWVGKCAVVAFAQPRTVRSAALFASAMNGRGEFSFLIADQAKTDGIIAGATPAAVTWALLLAVAASPVAFRLALPKSVDGVRRVAGWPAVRSATSESHAVPL